MLNTDEKRSFRNINSIGFWGRPKKDLLEWITPGLSNSIEAKNRVYKQFCKASDPIKKRKLHEW